MIKFEIDATAALAELNRFVEAFPREGAQAARGAINKTLDWVTSRAARAIADENDVPLKSLSRRRRISKRRASGQDLSGRLWLGMAPIKAIYLGSARQTRSGARVGSRAFPGSFLATMPSGHLGVFKRDESLLRRSKGRSAGSAPNLPITEQTVALKAAESRIRSIFDQAPERLRTVFLQEMRFRLFVQGKA